MRNRDHCEPRGDVRDAKGKNCIFSEEGERRQSNTPRLPTVEAGNEERQSGHTDCSHCSQLTPVNPQGDGVYPSYSSENSIYTSEPYGSGSDFVLMSGLRSTKQKVAAISRHFSLGSYFNW